MIKAIIFDFDGLILDTETYEIQSYQQVYEEHQIPFPHQRWLENIGTQGTFNPFDELLHAKKDLVLEKLDLERNAKYEQLTIDIQPREGVLEYLIRGKELGLKLAIASSSSKKWVTTYLERLGILPYFDCIHTSDDVKKVKPDPELYIKTINYFKLQPEEAIVFEDSANGSLAAIRAGIPCVIVPNETTSTLIFDEKVALRLKSKKEKTLDEVISYISQLK